MARSIPTTSVILLIEVLATNGGGETDEDQVTIHLAAATVSTGVRHTWGLDDGESSLGRSKACQLWP